MIVDEDLLVFAEAVVKVVESVVVAEGETEAVAIVLAPPPAVVTITTP